MSDMSFAVGPSPSGDMMKDSVISILRGVSWSFLFANWRKNATHV